MITENQFIEFTKTHPILWGTIKTGFQQSEEINKIIGIGILKHIEHIVAKEGGAK